MTDKKKKTKRFDFDPARVEQLLATSANTGSDGVTEHGWLSDDVKRWLGEQLGPFQISDYLDRGGMSLVFRGQRNDGQFEQQVAIKVLRAPDVEELVQRFERERQLLARVKHANIAHIIDGGVVQGQPWLAMELVDGDPIDGYCDDHRLNLDQRLDLFIEVARAVQFAHAQLIVHRDLKPSNILVTADGEAKLLDFGIAKALQDDDVELTGANLLLTPMYASPEQVQGKPVGVASDIYQLGLLLYRLLTGRNAQALDNPSVAEIKAAVVECDPLSPSRCVEVTGEGDAQQLIQIATARSITTGKLHKRLSGDLDAIVLKALEKEPTQRYPTVEKLVEDIECFRTQRPISARPITGWYRVRRFAQRHRGGVALSVLTALAIVGSLAIAAISSRATIKAQQLALQEAQGAIEVGEFWADMLEQASPALSGGDELTVRELLEASSAQLHQLDHNPRVHARVLEATAGAYESLGFPAKSEPLARQAVAIREQQNDQQGLIEALSHLSISLMRLGELDESVEVAKRALSVGHDIGADAPTLADIHNTLANVLNQQGDYDQVRVHSIQAVDLLKNRLDDRSKHLRSTAYTFLGSNSLQQGDYLGARDAFENALALLGDSVTDGSTRAWILRDLGHIHLEIDDDDRAIEYLRQSLDQTRAIYGNENPNILGGLVMLGRALCNLSCGEEPEQLFLEALKVAKLTIGEEHGNYARILHDYAEVFRLRGDFHQLTQIRDQAVTIADAFFGPDHSTAVNLRKARSRIELNSGHYRVAVEPIEKVLPAVQEAFGEDHMITFSTKLSRANALLKAERFGEAEAAMLDLVRKGKTILDGKFWFYRNNYASLSRLHQLVGPIETAQEYAEQALSVHRSLDSTEGEIMLRPLSQKIAVLSMLSKAQAKPDVELALALIENSSAPTLQTQLLFAELAVSIARSGFLADSQRVCAQALAAIGRSLAADQPLLSYAQVDCAEVYLRAGSSRAAGDLLRAALPILSTTLAPDSWRIWRARLLLSAAEVDADGADRAITKLRAKLGDSSPLLASLSAFVLPKTRTSTG